MNSASTAPAIDTTATENSASSDDEGAGDFGDVASEPGPDEDFDTAFGEEDDHPSTTPTTREGWLAAFQRWAAEHPTRESVLADDSWKEIFQSWANACQSKAEMDTDKSTFIGWAKDRFTVGRKAEPAKGIEAVPPDPGSIEMQKMFAARYKAVP